MYVPFITKCGHNFCYECITSWLDTNQSCPTCRAVVEDIPYLNIPLQSVLSTILEYCGKIDEEKTREFHEEKRSRIAYYQKDVENKNLFKKIFKRLGGRKLIDHSDGIDRCSQCHWEVHGNICENCGTRLVSRFADDSEEQDEDEEDSSDDGVLVRGPSYRHQVSFGDDFSIGSSASADGSSAIDSDIDDSNNRYASSDDSFVASSDLGDIENVHAGLSDGDPAHHGDSDSDDQGIGFRRSRRTIIGTDDDDDDDDNDEYYRNGHEPAADAGSSGSEDSTFQRRYEEAADNGASDDDDDDDDGYEAMLRARIPHLSSDYDSDDYMSAD